MSDEQQKSLLRQNNEYYCWYKLCLYVRSRVSYSTEMY